MIPRRRMPIAASDFAEWGRSLVRPSDAAAEDVARFEQAMREYLGCSFARATTSGRDAIELALDGAGYQQGDEIVVPAYTLGELIPLLQAKGLTPVPADIKEDTFNVDPACVAKRISERTRFVLATHLLGAPCDIRRICEVASERGIVVIEDCAHGLGASVDGQKVGTFGDAAIFSHEVNKAVPTYGGGTLVTRDDKIAEKATAALASRPRIERPALKKARSSWLEEGVIRSPFYGILARILFSETFSKRFEQAYRGGHDKLRSVKTAYSGFQGRLGTRRLAELDARNERLNRLWDEFAAMLPESYGIQVRDRVGKPAFYNFVARSPIEPRELRRRVMRRGVDIGIGTEVMDDTSEMLGYDDCPVARGVFGRAVLVPLYDGMRPRQVRKVARVLAQAVGGEAR